MKPKAIICDIDGTIAIRGDRSPYDMTKVGEDLPNIPVLHVVCGAWLYTRSQMIFVSGRDETARHDTKEWLEGFTGRHDFLLHMRADGDNRQDFIVKEEILVAKILPTYDVLCVFDDRRQVIQMWRRHRFTVFDVADGVL